MRLKILKRPPGKVLGISINHFRLGGVYDIGIPLADVLLADGFAELVENSDEDDPTPHHVPVEPLILVVDDDSGVRELAKCLLADHGCEVVVAAHGQEALECLRQRCPDLILLDLQMPVMDGWEFRQHQQEMPDRVRAAARVVLLSGDADATNQGILLGAVGTVKKPFDARDLLTAVWTAIGPQDPSVLPF